MGVCKQLHPPLSLETVPCAGPEMVMDGAWYVFHWKFFSPAHHSQGLEDTRWPVFEWFSPHFLLDCGAKNTNER